MRARGREAPALSAPLVLGEGLTRIYGRPPRSRTALAEVDVVVWPEDRVAIVGPSGSGKSTLLHLMAGLDQPTSGRIEWPGLGPPDRPRPGRIGVCFQGPSLIPALSVLENVALPAILAGRDVRSASAEPSRLLARFGLLDVSDRLPEQISGGQAQRAALARAFVGEPRLILADEPTAQQDREGATQVLEGLIEEAERLGAAVVVATHDPRVADRMRIRWSLRDGRPSPRGVVASSR